LIATTSSDNTARLWDAATGRQIGPPLEHPSWVNWAAFSPDDGQLATAGDDFKIRVWDLATQKQILPVMDHDALVSAVQFSPDGQMIVSSGMDRTTRFWSAADHRPLEPNPLLRHGDLVAFTCFSPSGHQIVTACVDGTACIWDLAGAQVPPPKLERNFSQDLSRSVTLAEQGIQSWDTFTDHPAAPAFNPGLTIRGLKLSPDGSFVLAVSHPETSDTNLLSVKVFATANGQAIGAPIIFPSTFTSFSLNKNGQRLLALGSRNAQTWNTMSGSSLAQLEVPEDGWITSARFNPDFSKVAIWGQNWVEVVDAATGKELFPALKHDATVRHVSFSPDGSRFVTCYADSSYTKCSSRIWDTKTGQLVGPPLMHEDGVLFASFSPDGSRLVTASEDYTALVWDVKTGRTLFAPLKHKNHVRSAEFSPDGKWIATVSWDKTARLWNAETGNPLGPPLRHECALETVAFFPDGKHLLTGNSTGLKWVWDLETATAPIEALQKLSRLLTFGAIAPEGSPNVQPGFAKTLWNEFQTNSPGVVSVSVKQLAAWEDFEAQQGELHKQWKVAAFHSRQLLAVDPRNQDALARLERAKTNLLRTGGLP
jgi:WD40 repeat protein